jgi:uncharacterized membrane protein YbhN (UPF0104 family)
VRWLDAARVSVIGSAANQLPIPGSVLVRVRALRQLGSSYRKASASTAIVAFAWIGTTGVMAGGFLLTPGPRGLGVGLLVAGLVALIVAYAMLRGQVDESSARLLMIQALLVEAGSVVVTAFRLYGILFALGFSVSVAQAMALTISAVVASAVGVFPGGLGIRELTAAAIGPLVGLPAAAAFLATAVDRLTMLVVLSLLSLLLLRGGFRPERALSVSGVWPQAEAKADEE